MTSGAQVCGIPLIPRVNFFVSFLSGSFFSLGLRNPPTEAPCEENGGIGQVSSRRISLPQTTQRCTCLPRLLCEADFRKPWTILAERPQTSFNGGGARATFAEPSRFLGEGIEISTTKKPQRQKQWFKVLSGPSASTRKHQDIPGIAETCGILENL